MSNSVARKVTPQLCHTDRYGDCVSPVRRLQPGDIDHVVESVAVSFASDAARNALVNSVISREGLAESFAATHDATWVAESDGRLTGHLHGTLLESSDHGRGIWVGPDGVSFDDLDTLAALYREAGARWIGEGALEHYVWTLDHPDSTGPWYEMGFARMHLRGVLALDTPRHTLFTEGYSIRRGAPDDLDLAVELDAELDFAQHLGPSFSIGHDHSSKREDLLEALEDPEVHHYVVERGGVGVAQCLTFPLPSIRGSFEDTLHLSAVTVREGHRGRGVATAMVDVALNDALGAGFGHVETNWRVTNRQAANHWRHYGFTPTYVRLHRTIGTF